MTTLKFVPGAYHLDAKMTYQQTCMIIAQVNGNWKYPIISVGSGKGHLEYLLKKDLGFEIIRVDPNIDSILEYDAMFANDPDYNKDFLPANYSSIDEIPDLAKYIHKCVLIMSWPVANISKNNNDYNIFHKLRPAILVASYAPCGAAGSIKFLRKMGIFTTNINSYQNICPAFNTFEEDHTDRHPKKKYHLWYFHDSIENTGASKNGGLTSRLVIYCADSPIKNDEPMRSRNHHGVYTEPEKPQMPDVPKENSYVYE